MQKVLILGAKGNLGQQLVKIFSKDNNVIAWDKEDADITDKELIFEKIKKIKPNIIINAAAYNAVDKCEENEEEFELAKKINGEAVGFLAEAALEIGAVLAHYSTDYVFNGQNKNGYKEDDKPNPINNYGRSKLMGEQAIIKLSGRGLKWYLIRTSKLFGPRGGSSAKPSFFDVMLKLASKSSARNSDKTKANTVNAVDEEASCFTYTPDLAKATKELVDSGKEYGIYHITNSEPCTWYEAAVELFRIAELDVKVHPVTSDKFPRPAKRPKYSVLVNSKFRQMRNWKKGLREYLKYGA